MRNFFITKEWESNQYQKMVSHYEELNAANAENTIARPMTPEEFEQAEKAIAQDRQYYKEHSLSGRDDKNNKRSKNRRDFY